MKDDNYQRHGGVPKEDEIIQALSEYFGAPEAAVISWLAALHTRFDPKAAQERLVARSHSAGDPQKTA